MYYGYWETPYINIPYSLIAGKNVVVSDTLKHVEFILKEFLLEYIVINYANRRNLFTKIKHKYISLKSRAKTRKIIKSLLNYNDVVCNNFIKECYVDEHMPPADLNGIYNNK